MQFQLRYDMEYFIQYLIVFAIGGGICVLGQILINLTKMTSAKILVTFLLLGVVLQAVGVFDVIRDFAKAGVTVPIIGFGATLTKGAMEGIKDKGLLGAFLGSIEAGAAGLAAAIFFGFIVAICSRARTKT